jgi:hypothetical protein
VLFDQNPAQPVSNYLADRACGCSGLRLWFNVTVWGTHPPYREGVSRRRLLSEAQLLAALGDQPALSNSVEPVKTGSGSRVGRISRTFDFVFLASQRKQIKLS